MDPLTTTSLALLAGVLLHPELPGDTVWWGFLAAGSLLLGLASRRWWALLPGVVLAGLVAGRSLPDGPLLEGPIAAVGVRVGAGSGRAGDVRLERPLGGAFGPGRVRVRFPGLAPAPGTPVVVVGEAYPVRRAIDGAPDPVRAAALSGVRTEVRATVGRPIGGDARDAIPAERDPTGILRALVLGDTAGCTPADLDVLRKTGTTHLLSVSGFHVGVAALLVRFAVRSPLRALAAWVPGGLPAGAADAVSIGAAWAYAWMAGMPVPAQRAAAALSLVALGRALGRRTAGVPALAAVAAALAIMDPGSVAGASFQLSFGAMVGLIVVSPALAARLPDASRASWPVKAGAEATITTVGTTLATLPASAWWFQAVPPLAIPANLVAMPVLGFLAVPCGAAACWAPWPLDALGAWVGTWLCRGALWALSWCAVDPWTPAAGPLGAVVLAGAVALGLSRPWWGALVGAGTLVTLRLPPGGTRVTFMDVGQGDAALVERADGTRTLVDGGAHPTAVSQWLRRQGIRRLDVVVQTHPDRDHAGGLPAVVRGLSVGRVEAYAPSPDLLAAAVETETPLVAMSPAWLWPRSDGPLPTGRNGASVVFAESGFLFTGDSDAASEALYAAASSRPEPVCVLKVGHHGSRTSTSPTLLAWVDAAVAVIPVGPNRYGHPADEVVERLTADGAAVWTTLDHGTIVAERSGAVVSLRSARGSLQARCATTP